MRTHPCLVAVGPEDCALRTRATQSLWPARRRGYTSHRNTSDPRFISQRIGGDAASFAFAKFLLTRWTESAEDGSGVAAMRIMRDRYARRVPRAAARNTRKRRRPHLTSAESPPRFGTTAESRQAQDAKDQTRCIRYCSVVRLMPRTATWRAEADEVSVCRSGSTARSPAVCQAGSTASDSSQCF